MLNYSNSFFKFSISSFVHVTYMLPQSSLSKLAKDIAYSTNGSKPQHKWILSLCLQYLRHSMKWLDILALLPVFPCPAPSKVALSSGDLLVKFYTLFRKIFFFTSPITVRIKNSRSRPNLALGAKIFDFAQNQITKKNGKKGAFYCVTGLEA